MTLLPQNPKAFCGPLQPIFLTADQPSIIIDSFYVLKPDGSFLADPIGEYPNSAQVEVAYGDTALQIKQKVQAEIRSLYGNNNIQLVYINDVLSLNL